MEINFPLHNSKRSWFRDIKAPLLPHHYAPSTILHCCSDVFMLGCFFFFTHRAMCSSQTIRPLFLSVYKTFFQYYCWVSMWSLENFRCVPMFVCRAKASSALLCHKYQAWSMFCVWLTHEQKVNQLQFVLKSLAVALGFFFTVSFMWRDLSCLHLTADWWKSKLSDYSVTLSSSMQIKNSRS